AVPRHQAGTASTQASSKAHLVSVARLSAALLVSAGLVVLAGWVLDITALTSLSPSWAAMKVNAALLFIACGIALHALADQSGDRRLRLAGSAAACCTVLVALLTLVQHLAGANFHIDELLMQQSSTAADTARPGRMSAAGAAA